MMNGKNIKQKINSDYQKFLKSVGFHPEKYKDVKLNDKLQPLIIEQRAGVAEMGNTIPTGGGYRNDIDDYKWKRNNESTATITEIERKKLAIAPPFSKGAYQYVTPETDVKTLGKKI